MYIDLYMRRLLMLSENDLINTCVKVRQTKVLLLTHLHITHTHTLIKGLALITCVPVYLKYGQKNGFKLNAKLIDGTQTQHYFMITITRSTHAYAGTFI